MNDDFPLAGSIAICDGFNMLLPTKVIADVVSAVSVIKQTDKDKWMLGSISWRGLRLPVISIEQLVIGRAPRLRGSHVAILHGTLHTTKMPFYAIPLQAMPNNFSISSERELAARADHLELNYCEIKVVARGVSAIIPKLEAIESKVLGLT